VKPVAAPFAAKLLRAQTFPYERRSVRVDAGAFILIAHDRTKTAVGGPAYISFPANAPPHALKCGAEEPGIFYLRYEWPFDIKYPPEGSKGECLLCATKRDAHV
jgi:hypothetical protein